VVAVVRDLQLDLDWDDLVLPSEPKQPDRFGELTDLLELSGSANRILASLRAAG
jgi:hypothetical protein